MEIQKGEDMSNLENEFEKWFENEYAEDASNWGYTYQDVQAPCREGQGRSRTRAWGSVAGVSLRVLFGLPSFESG